MAKVAVIGSGFAGLSAACYLSQAGKEVHVFEKNADPGGRARQLKTENGYVFDMGPSWYWMPDVFERFFNDFGDSVARHYQLDLLNPSFQVTFSSNNHINIPADFNELCFLFESVEKGSAEKLRKFMLEAKYKYETGMENLVYKPGLSLSEFADFQLVKGIMRLQVFTSLSKHIRKYFSHPHLIALMEFPVLFLGAMPQETPALYSLMNYAGLKLGTWYPQGGFGKIVEAMVNIARRNGTRFHLNSPVEQILVEENKAKGITVNGKTFLCDAVVGAADYHHIEKTLLPASFNNYKESYWQNKVFAPSCLIYYLGITKKLPSLQHHTLFFDEDLLQHSKEIYKQPQWPSKPLFYVCCPSRTDNSVAPAGHENLFLLMPLAPGLNDDDSTREKYFSIMMNRLQRHVGENFESSIDFKKSYCVSDFVADYHSYRGNAYGLANTLRQTAVWKPKITNKKLNNLFYAGQLTVPGPGVPPSLISGKLAANQVLRYFKKTKHEVVI